jgi:hypothetical protein
MKKIMLSFDVEEFDLPREFGVGIKDDEMFKIGYEGCVELLKFLDVESTFFVTANFAKKYPDLIKKINEKHEIGLHADEHKDNYLEMDEDEILKKLSKAKEEIEKIIGEKIKGFRAPRLQFDKYKVLRKLNIEYDSSYIPSYVPGRYNNFFGTRKRFFKEGILVIPISVIPFFRIPMAWYVFRNLGLSFAKIGTLLNKEVCLIFHPWEFANLEKFKIPYLIKRNSGEKMSKLLNKYLKWGKKYKFVRMGK